MATKGMSATDALKLTEPLMRYELGEGLELWKVPLAMIVEQPTNARAMSSDAFNQLTTTIQRTGRLESMPLAAWKENRLEMISGHHRVRAARKAELTEIWVLVDVTELDRDFIRAKQLAHNSIQGEDNSDIVAQIFLDIESAEARIEAFIEPDMSKLDTDVRLATRDLEVKFEAKVVTLLFLPPQYKVFKAAIEMLCGEEDDVFLATREEYDILTDVVVRTSDSYEIRSTPTIFIKMSEIVLEHLAEKEKADGQGTDEAA
jgi:hypothetical protein